MSQPQLLFQALSLDSLVLESLLKRHRNSHGRTLYFRRMSMVVQAMRRWQPLSLEEELHALQKERIKKDRRGEWSLKKDKHQDRVDALINKVCHGFPEILSRSLHASEALFTEVTRGFFLPFCTVALGALARICSILKRLGQSAISQLQDMTEVTIPLEIMQKGMETFLESSAMEKSESPNDQYESLLAGLGIHLRKAGKKGVAEQNRTQHATHIRDGSDMKKQPPVATSPVAVPNAPEVEEEIDIGESVASASMWVESKSETTSTSNRQMDSVVDQNLAVVESLKQQGTKKKSNKRKESSSSTIKSTAEKATKKKKKKKKSKKGDFFDSLFD